MRNRNLPQSNTAHVPTNSALFVLLLTLVAPLVSSNFEWLPVKADIENHPRSIHGPFWIVPIRSMGVPDSSWVSFASAISNHRPRNSRGFFNPPLCLPREKASDHLAPTASNCVAARCSTVCPSLIRSAAILQFGNDPLFACCANRGKGHFHPKTFSSCSPHTMCGPLTCPLWHNSTGTVFLHIHPIRGHNSALRQRILDSLTPQLRPLSSL